MQNRSWDGFAAIADGNPLAVAKSISYVRQLADALGRPYEVIQVTVVERRGADAKGEKP